MGPLLAAIMAAGPLISRLAGGAAQGAADRRDRDNATITARNALLAQLHGMRQQATSSALANTSREQLEQADTDLAQRRFALAAPSARAAQAVRGSALKNAQPVTLSGLPDRVASRIPQISGGLSPALFDASTRQLGDELTRSALLGQLKGDTFAPMTRTDFMGGVLPAPALEDYQRSGLLEKILGGLALGGSVLGGAGEVGRGWNTGRRQIGLDEDI
jgi:hypothetical protein